MRYKVTVSYDGNNYVGFQSQINGPTIQDAIEKVLQMIFVKKIRIVMASRTDAGVHAKGQVFHFDADRDMDVNKLKGAINGLIPKDIYVKRVQKVDENFHARYSSHTKTYVYLINLGEYDVFLNGYAFQCYYDLDIDKMIEASKLYIGTHDFSSFNTASLKEYPNQVRTILDFNIKKTGKMLKITVTGTGFLKNMVRIMVGTLIDLGRGKKSIKDIKCMLENPCKDKRRYNIDPNGLYLMKINY